MQANSSEEKHIHDFVMVSLVIFIFLVDLSVAHPLYSTCWLTSGVVLFIVVMDGRDKLSQCKIPK